MERVEPRYALFSDTAWALQFEDMFAKPEPDDPVDEPAADSVFAIFFAW